MRKLAKAALVAYGLPEAEIRFLRHAGNTLFRVAQPIPEPAGEASRLFADGRYLLRIHQPGYQTTDAIALELEWLTALRRDAGLPVPEPVPTLRGRLAANVCVPGVPGARDCSLLRWVRGRLVTRGIQPHHFRAQGRLMAQLHDHAAHWQVPGGFTKRRYDWNGLFRDDGGAGLLASEAWSLLPPSYAKSFDLVARRVGRVMDDWGDGPDVCGLIHADLGVDANVLFWKGEARAIDFDDSGIGYWIYDLAVALEHCREDVAYPRYRDALLQGYADVRPLPDRQSAQLELFMVAFEVFWCLWAAAVIHRHPERRDAMRTRMARAARLVGRYLEKNC
jgi:Ser/Thr protein kinase RdoA (MazF antagonist)